MSARPLKYVLNTQIEQLRLDCLNYRESVLLVHKEYISAFVTLESCSLESSRDGGVVVVGQPGIGM